MSKQAPKAWYRKGEDSWRIRLRGRLHTLAKGKANRPEAQQVLKRLLLSHGMPTEEGKSLTSIADAFLNRPEAQQNTESSRRNAAHFLRSFVAFTPACLATEVRKAHLQAWLNAHLGWSNSPGWTAAGHVLACLNWAVKEDLLPFHRLKGFKKPSLASRGAEAVIDDATHEAMLKQCHSTSLCLVPTVLRETGARPGELCQATAKDFDEGGAMLRLVKHKNARKGKQRFILLPQKALAIVKSLAEQHPTGALFRTRLGTAWTSDALAKSLKKLRAYPRTLPRTQ